jgi:uncharacterized membrane protein YhaH (DUF805 family)
MSKPVFEGLFKFSGRRNRKSYVLFALLLTVVLCAIWGIAITLAAGNEEYTMLVVAGLATIPLAISGWAVAAQRCRDFGWTGWAVLLTLVPYLGGLFGIAIVFIPGNVGANRYGPDPLNQPTALPGQ